MPRTPRDIETELLVLAAQGGCEKSLRLLIERHHQPLLTYAIACADSHDLGADALQDAWVQIVSGLRRLRDPASFRAWAYRVVTRRCADRVRAQQRYRRDPERPPPRPRPAADADAADALRSAIDALPRDLALTVRLYYAEGFPVRAVARILDIPENTVKSRLASARQKLAAAIEPEGATP